MLLTFAASGRFDHTTERTRSPTEIPARPGSLYRCLCVAAFAKRFPIARSMHCDAMRRRRYQHKKSQMVVNLSPGVFAQRAAVTTSRPLMWFICFKFGYFLTDLYCILLLWYCSQFCHEPTFAAPSPPHCPTNPTCYFCIIVAHCQSFVIKPIVLLQQRTWETRSFVRLIDG